MAALVAASSRGSVRGATRTSIGRPATDDAAELRLAGRPVERVDTRRRGCATRRAWPRTRRAAARAAGGSTVVLEVEFEGIDEHEADDVVAVGRREDPAVRAAERVTDHDVRTGLARGRQQRVEGLRRRRRACAAVAGRSARVRPGRTRRSGSSSPARRGPPPTSRCRCPIRPRGRRSGSRSRGSRDRGTGRRCRPARPPGCTAPARDVARARRRDRRTGRRRRRRRGRARSTTAATIRTTRGRRRRRSTVSTHGSVRRGRCTLPPCAEASRPFVVPMR